MIRIFGKAGEPTSQFLVIGGFYVERHGSTKPVLQADTPGAVIHIRGGHCELIGSAREVFDYRPDGISMSELTELAKDVSCRYIHAFGSKSKFLDAMRKQGVSLNCPLSVILKDAVSQSPEVCPINGN
jgi:hypothetical protein